jgi:transmembrane sensor
MTQERFLALLELYIAGKLTDADMQEWLDAFSQEEYRQLFEQHMHATFNKFETSPWNKQQVLQNIKAQTGMKRRVVKKFYRAAAAIVLLTAGYFIFNHKEQPIPHPVVTTTNVPTVISAPQTNRAVITLANGQQVFLDSMGNGAVASEGDVQVTKLAGGKIAYTGTSTQISYNTLANPKGSRVINMTFSDGSRVWLNAGSTLRYPVAFVGKERKVEISGEAYFEVAHNSAMPFIVQKMRDDVRVKVLGTHFNVNAYDDETATRVTLLEGAVQVGGRETALLRPGQQAVCRPDARLTIHDNVDLDEVMAWKNDRFLFGEKADIGAIMRQISRWYDVEVDFKGQIDQHLGGSISRHENVDAVLDMLEKTGAVRFRIDGRKVTVMPYSP